MKKAAVGLAFTVAVALGGSWTGYVSESKCGAAHQDGSAASVKCVTKCIKGGAKPVLVVDGKVIKIANPDKVAEKFYGLKVKVDGDMKDDTVTIASIDAAK